MLAVRWHGRRDVRVEQVASVGVPARGWARVRVEACGICGTDVEEFRDGPLAIPLTPNPLSGSCAPLTLGHETVGVVEEVGDDVAIRPGTRVAIEGNMTCRACFWCRRGTYALCPMVAALGLQADGGLAEEVLAPAYLCVPYSGHLAAESAALAEPLAVAVRAVQRAGIEAGSTVGVVGAGTIGLLIVQAARIAGAEKIVVVEQHERRRELALLLGADAAIHPEGATELADDLTSGVRFDVTLEAAGNEVAARASLELARRGGRAVLLGAYDGSLTIPMLQFLHEEKEIYASLSHTHDGDFPEAVRLLNGGLVDTTLLVSDRIGLPDVVARGFEQLLTHPERHLKIVVFPNGVPTESEPPFAQGAVAR